MSTSGTSGIGMSKHRTSGSTFKSRRAKLAMEREANKPKCKRPKSEMMDPSRFWKSVGAP